MMQTARNHPMLNVQVRIAVAVDEHGNYNAAGSNNMEDAVVQTDAAWPMKDGFRLYWLTATLQVPEAQTVEVTAEPKE